MNAEKANDSVWECYNGSYYWLVLTFSALWWPIIVGSSNSFSFREIRALKMILITFFKSCEQLTNQCFQSAPFFLRLFEGKDKYLQNSWRSKYPGKKAEAKNNYKNKWLKMAIEPL